MTAFCDSGTFAKGLSPAANDLEDRYRYEALKMLTAKDKISDAVIDNILYWHPSGFNIYCGPSTWPDCDKGIEALVRYIIRASFSQNRMTYLSARQTLDDLAKRCIHYRAQRQQSIFHDSYWVIYCSHY